MKVLIISHNPITTFSSMGKTFLSLFSSFEKRELCQLYVYPTMPDVDVCNSYYQVTDRDILKSYLHFGCVRSHVISTLDIDTTQHSMYKSDEDADFFKKKKKNAWTLMGRDLMWFFSRWYNWSLEQWLAEEKPTCIFLAPGPSKFIYNIALKIAKKLDIGIYTYICDDYYFVQKPIHFGERLKVRLLQRKMRKTLKKSRKIITICEELTEVYQKEFGVPAHTICTGSNYPVADKPSVCREIQGMTYMGNLSCNRFESIADIGRTLDKINEEQGTDYHLFLYTAPLKENIQEIFSQIPSIQFCGYVTGLDFEKTLRSADILLHVEAFDDWAIDRVKHSVSTKIADSLGSGTLLFAYGPANIASIQHLIRNRCACVVTGKAELKEKIEQLLSDVNREAIIQQALKTAEELHTSEKNSRRLHQILEADE